MFGKVLGVLDGRDMPAELLARWAGSADVVYAADGAADRLIQAGVSADVIVGDMDAVRPETLRAARRAVSHSDQDTTDCDKLLNLAKADGVSTITLASVEGDLPDHELATLHSAGRSGLDVRIAYRRGLGWILRSGSVLKPACSNGARVSLLPLASGTVATLEGVEWPLRDAALDPCGRGSISNRALGGSLQVEIKEGCALLFIGYRDEEMPFW